MKHKKQWGSMPSSSDLGALVKCEVEFCHERDTGLERNDLRTRAASARGQAEHDRAQAQMEAHHNRPHRTPAAAHPGSASVTDRRCFVASAVYGPDAPATDELRTFRDERLMPSVLGRSLVHLYYRLSPPLAGWVSSRPAAARVVRLSLDLVRRWLPRRPAQLSH